MNHLIKAGEIIDLSLEGVSASSILFTINNYRLGIVWKPYDFKDVKISLYEGDRIIHNLTFWDLVMWKQTMPGLEFYDGIYSINIQGELFLGRKKTYGKGDFLRVSFPNIDTWVEFSKFFLLRVNTLTSRNLTGRYRTNFVQYSGAIDVIDFKFRNIHKLLFYKVGAVLDNEIISVEIKNDTGVNILSALEYLCLNNSNRPNWTGGDALLIENSVVAEGVIKLKMGGMGRISHLLEIYKD